LQQFDVQEELNEPKLQMRRCAHPHPILPQDFTVDGFEGIKDPRGMLGVRMEMFGVVYTVAHILIWISFDSLLTAIIPWQLSTSNKFAGNPTFTLLMNIIGVGNAKSDGLNRGIVVDIDQTVQAIQRAVRQAEEKAGIQIKSVNVGLPSLDSNRLILHFQRRWCSFDLQYIQRQLLWQKLYQYRGLHTFLFLPWTEFLLLLIPISKRTNSYNLLSKTPIFMVKLEEVNNTKKEIVKRTPLSFTSSNFTIKMGVLESRLYEFVR
jgi:hypothetical protein